MRSRTPVCPVAALLVAGIPVLSGGCGGPPAPVPIGQSMYGHYGQVVEIQSAVATGRMEGARTPARWIADRNNFPELQPGLRPYERSMRMLARQVAEAGDLETAAYAVAEMGRTCGACHADARSGPRFTPGSHPPEPTGVRTHMRRHIWAADRLWEGLIGPSEESWQAGSTALLEAPLHPEWLADDETPSQEMVTLWALTDRVHRLGEMAATISDSQGRANLYGGFLAACAECHALLETFGR